MAEVDHRIVKARSVLIQDHPFFGALAMRLTPIARGDIDTMATDGEHLYYSTAYLDCPDNRPVWLVAADEMFTAEELVIFTVAHEVDHCALRHHTRRGGRDPKRWNIACDHAVNLQLKKARFRVPPWAYCDPRFEGFNAEEIYEILEREEQQQQQQQPQQPQQSQTPESSGDGGADDDEQQDGDEAGGVEDADTPQGPGDDEVDAGGGDKSAGKSGGSQDDGSGDDAGNQSGEGQGGGAEGGDEAPGTGSGGPGNSTDGDGKPGEGQDGQQPSGDPGRCGEILDAAPAHDKAAMDEAADEWEVYTRQAVNIARRQGEGKLPGFLEELVTDLDTPRIDWRDVLRRFVDPSTTKDYSWTHPSKRLMSMGYYVPGLVTDGVNHVAIAIDTSESIDSDWLRKFGGEAQAALDDGAVDKVTVIFADTRVHRSAEYTRGEQIDWTVQGRGGTAFAPTFAWIEEQAPDVSAAIYFTDLDCTTYGPQPTYPILWAAYGDPRDLKRFIPAVPFGEVMELKD